jgi:exo-beta-1,3-glucanase (GH17 family)
MRVFVLVGALIACVHAGLWALSREQTTAPNFRGQLASVSYTPFDGSADPRNGTPSTARQIRDDLKALAPYTRTIRTYSSTHGAEQIPIGLNHVRLVVIVVGNIVSAFRFSKASRFSDIVDARTGFE